MPYDWNDPPEEAPEVLTTATFHASTTELIATGFKLGLGFAPALFLFDIAAAIVLTNVIP